LVYFKGQQTRKRDKSIFSRGLVLEGFMMKLRTGYRLIKTHIFNTKVILENVKR